MNKGIENQYQSNIDMNGANENILSFREIPSLKQKKNLNMIASNFNSKLNHNGEYFDDPRKSYDNLIKLSSQNKLKRFKTQKNMLIRINNKNRVIKKISDINNDFILAKKNILYGNNLNNNEQRNFPSNNIMEMNNDIFAKKIKARFNRNSEQLRKYKIINNKTFNPQIHNLKETDISDAINYNNSNTISQYNKNSFNIQKKLSNDVFYKSDFNVTMPNPYERNNEYNNKNIQNYINSNNINKYKTEDNNNKIIQNKFLTNVKLTNQKISISKNINNIIQRQLSEIKPKIKKTKKLNKNDLSWDFGYDIVNKNQQNLNFYKKSKSGVIPKNFYSEKKVRNKKKAINKIKNNNDSSDKEIDDIVDQLELFFDEDNNKLNKTMIEKSNNDLNNSINLSDLADDIVNLNPEQETTVPSTSNLDTDGFLDNSNNNMNNINLNIPFNNNKISNNKPTIVNNFFISSPEVKNKNNNFEKDIKYSLFVVNEYNNTNNNINNNINNNVNGNNKTNINIPTLVTRTYKSPFNLGNNKNKINNKDINEIDESELNYELNQFKNMENENNNYQNDFNYLNNIKNINDKNISTPNYIQNIENENINLLNNQKNSQSQNNNIKKKLKYNIKEKSGNSILRDILSSRKNTPSNNNIQISDKKFIDMNEKLYDNNEIIYNNQNSNNYFINEVEETKIKDESLDPNEFNNINNFYMQNSDEANNNINNNSIQNKPKKKAKGHISFNLDNNIYIKFTPDNLINDSLVTDKNGQIYNHEEKNMLLYQTELKIANPKSIIKSFNINEIRINNEYIYVENLHERQILPDLYDEFEEDDLKSLEKCLEKSVDKIQH